MLVSKNTAKTTEIFVGTHLVESPFMRISEAVRDKSLRNRVFWCECIEGVQLRLNLSSPEKGVRTLTLMLSFREGQRISVCRSRVAPSYLPPAGVSV